MPQSIFPRRFAPTRAFSMPRILSRDEASLARRQLADALRGHKPLEAAAWQALLGERGPLSPPSDELNELLSQTWQSCDLLTIEAYLAAGADPGAARASSGTSALLLAAHRGDLAPLRLFLQASHSHGSRIKDGVSPLISALSAPDLVGFCARRGAPLVEVIEAILPFFDCNTQLRGSGHTPLAVAAIKGLLGAVALLAPRTDLSIVDAKGNSPLANLCACKRQDLGPLSLAQALLIPELANAVNKDGLTPLEIAASGGHATLASALLAITDLSAPRTVNGHASTLLTQATLFASAAGQSGIFHAIAAHGASIEALLLADASPTREPLAPKAARL